MHPCAAVMKRNLGGIVCDAAARAEACGVRMHAVEIIEPELWIILAGIVFDQSELRPAHGAIEPGRIACGWRSDFAEEKAATEGGGVLEEGSSGYARSCHPQRVASSCNGQVLAGLSGMPAIEHVRYTCREPRKRGTR